MDILEYLLEHQISRTTIAGTFHMGGGIYQEQASLGALYSESDTFNYKSPPGSLSNEGGTATQSINVIGSIGRGGSYRNSH